MARAEYNRTSNLRDLRGATPPVRSRGVADNQLQSPVIARYASPEPYNANLPQAKDLVNLSDVELANVLTRFGVVQPWPQLRAETVGYLNRVSQIPPGTPQFTAEVERLLDIESKSGLLNIARSSYRDFSLAYTDTSGDLIRICEDDENSCVVCIDLGGKEGTIEYHKSIGMAGSQSCLGGPKCRCQYMAVS
jgi:hypothetical protein